MCVWLNSESGLNSVPCPGLHISWGCSPWPRPLPFQGSGESPAELGWVMCCVFLLPLPTRGRLSILRLVSIPVDEAQLGDLQTSYSGPTGMLGCRQPQVTPWCYISIDISVSVRPWVSKVGGSRGMAVKQMPF